MRALPSIEFRRLAVTVGFLLSTGAADAYVNGGDKKNNLNEIRAKILADGFRAAIGHSTETIDPANVESFDRWVKQFTARAIAELPPDERELVTKELRDELAATAKKVLAGTLKYTTDTMEKHTLGPFECKVGGLSVLSWWETNYRGKGKEIHARRVSGFCPFIALKLSPKTETTPDAK